MSQPDDLPPATSTDPMPSVPLWGKRALRLQLVHLLGSSGTRSVESVIKDVQALEAFIADADASA